MHACRKRHHHQKKNVHVTALDGVVNVNSLFTIAIFLGLAMASPGQLKSLNVREECQPRANTAKMLVVFEILSFSFFLFSSLVAQSIKLSLNLQPSSDKAASAGKDAAAAPAERFWLAEAGSLSLPVDETLLTTGVMFSAMSSVIGCLFLLVSMVNVIELKLGVLSCMATSTIVSVAFLIPLSLAGILIYVFAAINRYVSRASSPDNDDDDTAEAAGEQRA